MVKAFAKHGVENVVIAPGSRNSPLTIAFAQAAQHFTLLSRIDERTAAFTALGIAKRIARPVAVICTSGTAAAHFTAAAFEAREAGVPLILVTADRPASVRGRGANQTIEQVDMFRNAVIDAWDLPLADAQEELYWELAVANAITASLGDEYSAAGPVHLNVAFKEPLVPGDAETTWVNSIVRGELPVSHQQEPVLLRDLLAEMKVSTEALRGVIIISDPNSAAGAISLAEKLQWPLLAEPGSSAGIPHLSIQHYARILQNRGSEFAADIVITAGRFGLSRAVAAYVSAATHHIAVGRYPLDADPSETAAHHVAAMPLADGVQVAPASWLEKWRAADDEFAQTFEEFNAHAVCQAVDEIATARDLIWVAASLAVRVMDDVATPRSDSAMMLVNRGANGIDGLIASATGAAIKTSGRTFLVLGDIAFVHDLNSLILPATESWPNLTIVVLDNNGGQIFKTLEQGATEFDSLYDKVYGTPHNRNLCAIAASTGLSSVEVTSVSQLQSELKNGTQVIVAKIKR